MKVYIFNFLIFQIKFNEFMGYCISIYVTLYFINSFTSYITKKVFYLDFQRITEIIAS